jgi:hypothetical protein
MKTPFRLRKVDEQAPVAAVLFLTDDVRVVLPACGGSGPLPPIYAVPGGFLLKTARDHQPIEGAIRLRRLAENLFLPVDAILEPALLDEEAVALVRDRGLVFLPGDQVLGFVPQRPLTAAELLTCHLAPPGRWQPLPAPPMLPDRLREILLDRPQETAEQILQAAAGDAGTAEPRPSVGSMAAQAAAGAAAGAGYGLVWLGQRLGLGALARLGASLIRRGMRRSPRLSENVLGRQEAALRELLRKFREGRLEDALRHALPLNAPAGRGSQPAGNAQLPTHRTRYNLRDLLFGGSGPAALWLGGPDVQAELAREYRKAAEDAAARGDWRRAAFIWGRLLHDHRQAAAALARGGLHHDAAILYLEIVGDTAAAAREFEAAGEIDRALALYRRLGDHIAAGDLLRRAGEEHLALQEYWIAAERHAAAGDHVAAGDLLRDRAGRADLALPHYEAGWARRPYSGAFHCLARLLPLRAAEPPDSLRELLDEADAFFHAPGSDTPAAQFYTSLASLAEEEHLAARRDDLRDRALLGLAYKLRQQSEATPRAGNAASTLFGRRGVWHPAVVHDAAFAARAAGKASAQPSPQVRRMQVRAGNVTAVCSAAESGALFLGYEDGVWAVFDPVSECVVPCPIPPAAKAPVLALASDRDGKTLVVLHAVTAHSQIIASYRIETYSVQRLASAPLFAEWMTPIAEDGGPPIFGLWQGQQLCIFRVPDFVATGTIHPSPPESTLRQALLRYPGPVGRPRLAVSFGDGLFHFSDRSTGLLQPVTLLCSIRSTMANLHVPLAHLWPTDDQIELAGVQDGTVTWMSARLVKDTTSVVCAVSPERGYRAIALLPYGRIAAVHSKGIDWLRRNHVTLVPTPGPRLARDDDAVACTYSPATSEVLVVLRGGTVVRVPIPG